MGDPVVLREDERVQQGDGTDAANDLARLRQLLLAPEQRHIEALHARLNDAKGRAEDLAEVLPQVLLRHTQDPQFTRALTPPIEKAITTSVQRNPKPLADALFPVMGPAIRMAVAAGLAGMVESLNRTLEYSLSWRSLQWRIEGWRTGKSFAEVVLAKTLVYRVEQIFLIDRKTGLLLQHAHAADSDVQDADMVSGMLTAIKDFVQDSFHVASSDSLEALKVGELSVWIEAGPHAVVAAVIRGAAPREFRRTLQDLVESLHLQFGEALAAFSGDASAFADARASMEACLETRYRAGERKPRTRGTWLLVGATVIALATWGGFEYRARQRWSHYLELLGAEPGLVVVSAGRESGRYVVAGLRDPLARDPQSLLAAAGVAPARVVGRWAPYQALEPSLVLTRAAGLLRPPDGTSLTLENGVLAATGRPARAWVIEAVRLAPFVAGVTRFDAARTLAPAIEATTANIQRASVLFVKGASEPGADQQESLARLVHDVRELSALADVTGVRFRVVLSGHTDSDGPEDANLPLSLERARTVLQAIGVEALPGLELSAQGVGSTEPADPGQDESSNRKNRRVAARVTALDAPR